jgi:hypothetical protein
MLLLIMSKATSGAATVIDLEAFRQRKLQAEQRDSASEGATMQATPMFVPVWYLWVPVWAPVMP